MFLYAETAEAPLHVMGALVLESHGRGTRESFTRMRAQIERLLRALPIRIAVAEVPSPWPRSERTLPRCRDATCTARRCGPRR